MASTLMDTRALPLRGAVRRAASAVMLALVAAGPAFGAVVSGSVTDQSGGVVPGTTVALLASATQQQVATAVTDTNGAYVMTVATDTYDVHVTPPQTSGFLPQTIPGVAVTGTTTLNIVLVQAEPVHFDVTVGDDEGAPFVGLTVRLKRAAFEVFCTTDAQGACAFDVPPGNYDILVSGYAVSANTPPFTQLARLSPITLAQDTSEAIVATTRVVTGTVLSPDGNPVGNAAVRGGNCTFDPDATVYSVYSCLGASTTDAAGHFQSISGRGTFSIQITPPPNSGSGPAVQDVTIVDDMSVTFTLPPALHYSLTVLDDEGAPLPGVTIEVRQGPLRLEDATDAQGTVSFELAPGDYAILVEARGSSPNAPAYAAFRGGFTIAQDTSETLVVPTRVLTGTVLDHNGNPVANAAIQGGCAPGPTVNDLSSYVCLQITSTDAAGHFQRIVLPGTFDLQIIPLQSSGAAGTSTTVTIVDDESVTFTLPTPVHYSVTVLDDDGAPLVGLGVRLTRDNVSVNGTTDAQGVGAFDVEAGSYGVGVGGHAAPPNGPGYAGLERLSWVTLTQDMNETINVPTRVLTGTVLDPDGNPISNASIFGGCGSGPNADGFTTYACLLGTSTDGAGHFQLIAIPGTFQLQIAPPPNSGFLTFSLQNLQIVTDTQLAVLLQFQRESLLNQSVVPGGTLTTDAEGDGATYSDPVETTVTVPANLTRTVSITETAITVSPPAGYRFLTQQIDIEISPANATVSAPFVLRFRLDASRIPADQDETTVKMSRNGALVEDCADASGDASPDPCVAEHHMLADDGGGQDLEFVVLTTHASSWNFGVELPPSDTDGDGVIDAVDNCPTPNPNQADGDGDDTGDACDGCPADGAKTVPGACGCGTPDTDTDADGVADCLDNCPATPNVSQLDGDDDGYGDACDGCPNDAAKLAPGACGCGAIDSDGDADGVATCIDNCPVVANPNQADVNHDGIGDACDLCASTPAVDATATSLKVTKLATGPGDDTLVFKGTFVLPSGTPFAALDPVANGAGIRLSGATSPALDVLLPAGAYDPVFKRGWKTSRTKRTYQNKTASPPGGITTLTLQDRGSSMPGLTKFTVNGKRGRYPVTTTVVPTLLLPGGGFCVSADFAGPPPGASCVLHNGILNCR